MPKGYPQEDLTGKRFGRLVVKELHYRQQKNWSRLWDCLCDCGISITASTGDLNGRRKRSCGCLRKDILGARRRLPKGTSQMRSIRNNYKYMAKIKGRVYDLTDEQFETLTKTNCFYCGSAPSRTRHEDGANGDYTYNGIDRIDSSKGYTKDNCVPCCLNCNRAKNDMPQQDFYVWINKVYKHFKKPASIAFIM